MQIGGFQPNNLQQSCMGAQVPARAQAEEKASAVTDGFAPQELQADTLKADLDRLMGESRIKPGVVGKQFADSYGRVKNLALMLSSYVHGETRTQVLNAYKELFTKMEPDTKFTIVVESPRDRKDIENVIAKNNVPNPERIKLIDSKEGNNTVWARDCMVPEFIPGDDKHTLLLAQNMFHNWHGSDMAAVSQITDADPSIILDREPRIITDGGEVMANTKDSFTSIYSIGHTAQNIATLAHNDRGIKDRITKFYTNTTGKTVVPSELESMFPYKFQPASCPREFHAHKFEMVRNEGYEPKAVRANSVDEGTMYEDMAVKLFEQQFGKPLTVMGKQSEPATDHLDMGMTPVDDKTMFLGDVSLAKKLIGKLPDSEKRQIEANLESLTGKKVDLDEICNSRNGNNQADFDNYEKTLKEKGYNVVHVPHLAPDRAAFGQPYISYNNCLMERFEKDGKEVKRVFLPNYGISSTDNYANDCFRKQGFEVIPLQLDGLSAYWGALRCISNWLDRSPKG